MFKRFWEFLKSDLKTLVRLSTSCSYYENTKETTLKRLFDEFYIPLELSIDFDHSNLWSIYNNLINFYEIGEPIQTAYQIRELLFKLDIDSNDKNVMKILSFIDPDPGSQRNKRYFRGEIFKYI